MLSRQFSGGRFNFLLGRSVGRERGGQGRGRNCTTPLGLILPLQLSAMKSSRDRDNCNRREGSRRNEADFTLTKCYFDALRAHPVTSLSRDELESSSFRPLGSIILRWWKCLSLSLPFSLALHLRATIPQLEEFWSLIAKVYWITFEI